MVDSGLYGSALRVLPDRSALRVSEVIEEFLGDLGGPTLLRVEGRDPSRTRVVSTLIHGNEPSGVRALHGWLRSGAIPAVDTLVFIASVAAALEPPGFSFRALPGARDLNRCFSLPFDGPEGALARAALEAFSSARPEALIDLHNNSGHSPSYAVAPNARSAELRLASLFGDRFVHSELKLGALVETTSSACPSVTIECGRAGDPAADGVARRGLEIFLHTPDLSLDTPAPARMTTLGDPIRVRALPGIRIAFGDQPAPDADLTMMRDVDRHNFCRLPISEPIGWLRDAGVWPIEAVDASGSDRSREFFEVRRGRFVTRRALVPIMMTLDPEIATSDCLFYAVQPSPCTQRLR